MKQLVTKLRKGPVPATDKKPDSPESMGSLFAEAGQEYAPESEDEEDETKTVRPQPAVTPLPVGGTLNKPRLPKSRT